MDYVYIIASKRNGTLYTGVTNDLSRRIQEHRLKYNKKSFSTRYDIHILVYYEDCGDIVSAIEREKKIKGWVRKKKIELIESINPTWNDLSEDWF